MKNRRFSRNRIPSSSQCIDIQEIARMVPAQNLVTDQRCKTAAAPLLVP